MKIKKSLSLIHHSATVSALDFVAFVKLMETVDEPTWFFVGGGKELKVIARGVEFVQAQTWSEKDIPRQGTQVEQGYESLHWLFVPADFGLVH